jgi:hypothetical protein
MTDVPPGPGWWLASDHRWYPPEAAASPSLTGTPIPDASTAGSSAPFILTIGDIGVTPELIVTPNGSAPLAGSQWLATDMTRTESKIPTVAIVLAVIFAFACLLGLLFLLMKEEKTTGYVDVTVRSADLYHRTQLPISSPLQVAQVRQLVAQAQALAARAG